MAILNIVDSPHREGPVVSILLDDADVVDLMRSRVACARVDELLQTGRRLTPSLATPALSPHERWAA